MGKYILDCSKQYHQEAQTNAFWSTGVLIKMYHSSSLCFQLQIKCEKTGGSPENSGITGRVKTAFWLIHTNGRLNYLKGRLSFGQLIVRY